MRRAPWLLLACACGPVVTDLGTAARQPIWGGVDAPDDAAVFRINNSMAACSSALIGSRTLLTADHCAFSGNIVAENLPSSAEVYTVIETRRWIDAFPDAGQVDIALMYLDRAPPVTPLPWDWLTRSPAIGTPVRHIGYGGSDNGGSGTRRTVVTTIVGAIFDVTSGQLVLSGNRDAGACYGDSGGPMLLIGPDGGERLLGVNSRLAGADCGEVASVIVPRYRELLEGWLSTHEDAGCAPDLRCVPGCEPVDRDCVCSADGQCTAACPELDDPDCPADCRTNNRCSTEACPRPDTDCTAPGDPCFVPAQCPGRKCLADPQNPSPYCTGSCDAGCAAGFQCDAPRDACIKAQRPEAALGEPCTAGVTLCRSGECLEDACRTPCTLDTQCADAGELCREPEPRFCAPTVVLPPLEPQHPSKGGCEVGAGLPFAALAMTWLRTLRRRLRIRRAA